jgi:tricorn protease
MNAGRALTVVCLAICVASVLGTGRTAGSRIETRGDARSGQRQGPLLLQQPTLSRTHIAFVFAGNLWVVDRDGGDARRLTSHLGRESDPVFSPDGKLIAFTGDYDGNADVYVTPAAGGPPRRLTYHPGYDRAAGWTPDGKQVLFASPRNSPVRYPRFDRLFTMPLDGVFPTELPLPTAEEGSFSPDGSRLAYMPIARQFFTRENGVLQAWKRYRGGMTSRIWLARLADSSIEKIPRANSNDFNPMWVGEKVYFLSDRSGPVTLFVYDTTSKRVRQLLENHGLDIKSASAGPGVIVYEQFGSIHLFDLASGKEHPVPIRVKGDFPEAQPRLRSAASLIRTAGLSPTGSDALFEARGEILTASTKTGAVRDLTNTPGIAERDPVWSPDGRWIAYFSDESGEYALHVREASGRGEVRKIPLVYPPYFNAEALVWSPDSKKITYVDIRLNRWYMDLDRAGKDRPQVPIKVDQDLSHAHSSSRPSWSPDSHWLVYTKQLKSLLRAVFVCEPATGKIHQLTDGLTDAQFPRFDKSGKYLYFTAGTDARPALVRVYVILLRKDLPSPLTPPGDGEKERRPPQGADAVASGSGTTGSDQPHTGIDLENIERRILALPPPDRNYVGMEAGRSGTLFLRSDDQNLYRFDLATGKTERLLEGVTRLALSEDGQKILYQQGDRWAVAAADRAPRPDEGTLRLDGMQVQVDPRAEWRQMYREVWRNQRDWFYDPRYHGLDLKGAEKQYEPYLENVASRADLNYLFAEMLGGLSASHIFIYGGDQPEVKPVPIGLLGADYRIENGRYRFARLYQGDTWNPDLRGPLTEPGVNIQTGEYLLAVNGRELQASDNVYRFFQDTIGKPVRLRVGPQPDGAGAQEVTVVPVESEKALRAFAWSEENRRRVDQMSGGRVAYVYMPDAADAGNHSFNRYYFAQADEEGLVIDERFNTGGTQPDFILDQLRRPLLFFTAMQLGIIPANDMGPKTMIINEWAGSEGDQFPWLFRRSGFGPLIGQPTWGAGTGIMFTVPSLIDGGFVSVPNMAVLTPAGRWPIENHGTDPDIEVEFDPQSWRAGRDPQLERAVGWVLKELEKHPIPKPKRPLYPSYPMDRQHPGTRRP